MGFDGSGKIWMSGKLVDWNDATVHVGSHVLHYGSSIFEGIRMYDTPKGSAIFRLKEHIQRLFNSAKIYRMEIPYTFDQILDACLETLKANGDHDAYLRPIVYRGYKALAVDPRPCPVEVSIMTWRWGKYLGDDALEKGVDVCVSTWTRMAPNTFPALAKCGANYMNSQLIKQEAIANGYVEGIALDATGYVSEGSGENLFVVWDDKLLTPPLGNSVLPGITRDTIIKLARDMGIEVVEQMIHVRCCTSLRKYFSLAVRQK